MLTHVFSFTNSHFCSFENLLVKFTFYKTIKIHFFVCKSAFIYNLKIVYVPNERNLLCKTSLTSIREFDLSRHAIDNQLKFSVL